MILLSVCPPVCLSVTVCDEVHILGRYRVGACVGLNVVPPSRRVPRRGLPIHLFRHFNLLYRLATTHNEILTSEISCLWIAMGILVKWMVIPWCMHGILGGSVLQLYIVYRTRTLYAKRSRPTIGLLSDSTKTLSAGRAFAFTLQCTTPGSWGCFVWADKPSQRPTLIQ